MDTKTHTTYTCPGEKHPISRPVHLSRLVAFYPKCRECIHRTDTGQLAHQTVERLQSTEKRVERASLFTAEGVRGIYLNELTRKTAAQAAGALASLLWDETPLSGCTTLRTESSHRSQPRGPKIVVGYDERSSSPNISTGIVAGLRRMGCNVIEIGLTTKPCFCFTVDHVQAMAGLFVTGSGRGPSWTGIDFVGPGGQPYSRASRLDQIESRYLSGFQRPTRQAGRNRVFQGMVPYQAGLWKHFHALRPLRIVCGSASWLVERMLKELFEKLPCEIIPVEIPQRVRDLHSATDNDSKRITAAVARHSAHVGMIIDDDACRCAVFDEQGRLIPAVELTCALAQIVLLEYPKSSIVIEDDALEELQPEIEAFGGHCRPGGVTLAQVSTAIKQFDAVLGGGSSGRFWFRESAPTCDAILTLAHILQAISRSDAPLSKVVAASISK